MIRIKDLTVKNFMSVGNTTQAVDFGKEQLTLVLGENLDQGGDDSGSRNGTGKTTIVNALSYALFGQALTNIKRDNLINKINGKNMLVTVEFEKGGRQYRIERGRRPNVLKFFIDDQEYLEETQEADDGQGDSRETQKDIDELLGMSHDMFKHIVALNTYTEPFLSMKANDQRAIIEQLLGITLLSEKAESLKELIRLTKEEITQETVKIDAVKASNDKIQESINSLRLKQSAWQKSKTAEMEKIKKAIEALAGVDIDAEIRQHEKLKIYDEQSAKIKSLNKERATLETAIMQAEKAVKKCLKDLEQLENHTCPACEQELHDHKHKEMISAAEKNLKDSDVYLSKISTELKSINKELETIGDINGRPETFYDTLNEAYNHRSNLDNLAMQLKNKGQEVDTYQEQITELENTALQPVTWDNINALTSVKDHQEFLLKLLTNKDSFIRKKIIDQNLAYLNNRLTYYLDKMGLPHTVIFQNDLSVEITQLGQDLDFDNLSRGERNRLILGLSWAFRDVWESLYENINLLFIDELIDSGMDANGVENSLGILKKMGRERNKNIYLISHKDELIGRVNNVLRVIKENGFTSYANDIDIYD
jgi:DNA repair exonuclease SbcCD ATPase subunit